LCAPAKDDFLFFQIVANPYTAVAGEMKQYHHPSCLFETFLRARSTTRIIMEPDDVHGFDDLVDEDQKIISDLIDGNLNYFVMQYYKF
jgi:DNA ligase 3